MKKYLLVYIVTGLTLLAGFALYASLLKVSPRPDINNPAVNEITKQTAFCWQELERLEEQSFGYRFLVFDNYGVARYASGENMPDSLPSAVRQGFLPMDITIDATIVGKALVEVYPDSVINQAQEAFSRSVLIVFLLLAALIVAAMLTLHINVVRPFWRLEAFAHKISVGKFDEPLPMDRRNVFGLFTQTFDVMRASLLEARQKQFIAERAQKELIASLNHDIKTPITSITLTSELLQARPDTSPDIVEKLRLIDAKADQISRLVNDMLHSTLEELGELKINTASHESSVLREIFKNVDLLSKTRLSDIPSCLIELDVTRMEQVIGNIVTNSYKYAATDIQVSFRIVEAFLHIEINDFGGGVAPEELELICTKFYRGENAKASHKGGEGLGLYIAKHLMEKMNGGLEASNRSDGFTIRLWIPLS